MSELAVFPLTSPQRQIWLHQQLLPHRPLYNIGGGLRITGDLALDDFERALREAVASADALRMVLVPGDPLPRQVFPSSVDVPIARLDFSRFDDPERAARDWMLAEFRRPLALHDGLLFDFAILKTAPTRYYWFHKYHHLVNDGWGISLVVQRVAAYFAALRAGEINVPARESAYAKFAAAEPAYLGSPQFETDRTYWSERLSRPPSAFVPARPDASSTSVAWEIDRAAYSTLGEFCRVRSASVFHLLLTALYTWLARSRGVNDVVIGVPALNRKTAREKTTVGLYAGLKPARSLFDPRESAQDFMTRIRAQLARDYRHYRMPLASMPRGLSAHDRAQSGIFDVVLSFERHDYDAAVAGHPVHMEAFANGFEQNGLVIFVRDYHQAEPVRVDVNYNIEALRESEVRGLLAGLESLLHDIERHPTRALGTLALMPALDRAKLTGAWARGESRAERADCVHDWLSARARADPDAPAIACGGDCLTFRDLDERANALAWRLQAAGVGPECCVGIVLPRTSALLVGVVAVLKAGGAYVPIDGAYPGERIRWMVRDAGIRLILAERGDLGWLAADGVRVETIDDARAPAAPPCEAHPDNLAYVIYTSGSTGRPKGVMVSHRSISNYLAFAISAYDMSASPALVPLHSSLGFDATVTSLLAPLLAGGCVQMLPGANGLAALCDAMSAQNQFGTVKVTPSHLGVLEDELGRQRVWSRPRSLVLGGEALHDAALTFWRAHAPATRVFNEYGPTEAAVGCCVFEVPRAVSNEVTPIGWPIWNSWLYVLDSELEPVAVGWPGELYVGGVGLARGYVGQPRLTAELFVPDRFGEQPGARLYRTGDLVRYRPDGCLEYIGRRDAQVKLRGHRVELGEIEAVMRAHPRVRDVAVALEDSERGHPRLIGYVAAGPERAIEAEELKRYARQWLPELMVPAAWVVVDHLPLTPHGKIDRGQLPLLARAAAGTPVESSARAPTLSAIERELITIWSDVLGVSNIGVLDNFFDLRGDSILALRIVSRARAHGIEIALPAIFKHQTIASLAAVAKQAPRSPEAAVLVEPPGPVPLTPIARWFLEQAPPDIDHYTHIAELEVAEDLSYAHLETALDALVAHHRALRLRVRVVDGEWVQEVADREATRLLTVVDLDVARSAQAALIDDGIADLQRGIHLGGGPVFCALLCVSAGHAGRLFLAAHHLAVDVVSWRILLDDLEIALRQLAAHEAVSLAPAISFSQWAAAQHASVTKADVIADTAHWLGFGDVDPTLIDPPSGVAVTSVGAAEIVEVSCSRVQTASIVAAAANNYRCRVDELLLTALACGYRRLTGRPSLFLALEGHGRDSAFHDLDLSRTVGWLTSIYPVRLTAPDPSADAPERVRNIQAQLRATPHKGHGYGLLRYLSPDRRVREALAAMPQPELLFNYVGDISRGDDHDTWIRGIRSLRLSRHPDARRLHSLELDVAVIDHELRMQWTFARDVHPRAAIERIAQLSFAEISGLAEAAPQDHIHAFTPDDFPAARLAQSELDLFLTRFR